MSTPVNGTDVCPALLSQYVALRGELAANQCQVDGPPGEGGTAKGTGECSAANGEYTLWLHIVTIFVVLASSFIGTIIPVLGKCVPRLQMHPFALVLGKCASTGVLLSVSMIHLISHAAQAFEEECVPESFKDSFDAYAFLFAMIAAILMHALDLELDAILERWALRQAESPTSLDSVEEQSGDASAKRATPDGDECLNDDAHVHAPHYHHHSHAVAAPSKVSAARSLASALFMEFGVTLHSVFVGLAVGIADDADTKVLLVALVFHQMFEGLALGSRLADASMRVTMDVVFALIFSVSAPLGAAVGTAVVAGTQGSLAGTTFVMVRAVSDSLCGGIMMYLGFGLLFSDFPTDMRKHAGPDAPHRGWKRLSMYAALWLGAGLMSVIGKWV